MSFSVKPFKNVYSEIIDKAVGLEDCMAEYNPGNFVFSWDFEQIAQKILDFEVRENDTWIVSYPRTGSTWCQEMVWLIGNDLDFDRGQNSMQLFRAPLLELSALNYIVQDKSLDDVFNSVDYVTSLPSPRFVKTHMPYQLLPTQIHKVKPKIVYPIRNPKDVCVSYYFFCKLFLKFNSDFEQFCELFLNNAVWGGGIFNHYFEFWNRRHEENILVLRYEDMKKNTRDTIKKIANFMEKELTEDDIDAMEDYLSFNKLKQNKGCNFEEIIDLKYGKGFFKNTSSDNHFLRKGEVGDWRNHMSSEMSKRFDEWIEKNTEGTDLSFQDDIPSTDQ